MARKGYIVHDQQAIYYMTFTVVGWIDIFPAVRSLQLRTTMYVVCNYIHNAYF